MTVLHFPSDRRSPAPDDDASCTCGSRWFALRGCPSDPPAAENGAVTVRCDGQITGYVGIPHCVECGQELHLAVYDEVLR